mmetsp:Transcript_58911/g.111130  ORF Transcript_58911/g.111130 Transcript_58911/m.111130 type:complete len:286 (-) Transcript_58911:110-967(-)
MADDWDPFADPAESAEPAEDTVAPAAEEPVKPKVRYVKAAKVPVKRKIRVLVLHGTCSSSSIMQKQLYALTSLSKEELEFVYLDGHLPCTRETTPELVPMIEQMEKFFGTGPLFQYALPDIDQAAGPVTDPANMLRIYKDLDEGMELLKAALEREEPIDAVLGFSQGSNLGNVLTAMAGLGMCKPLCCMVHMCSHKPGWVSQKPELFAQKIQVPAMVIYGEKDTVAYDRGEIAELYENAVLLSHSGPHQPLPSGKEGKSLAESILEFIKKQCRVDFYADDFITAA